MTVAELKEALEDFGDHLPVVLSIGLTEAENFTVEPSTDSNGVPCAVLEAD